MGGRLMSAGPTIRRTAERDGALAALAALHRAVGPETLYCGPAGHVIAPAAVAESAREVWLGGIAYQRADLRETDLTTPAAARAGVTGLRFTGAGPVPAGDPAGIVPSLWLRFGLSVRLRSQTLSHLKQRRAGDTLLLHQQMIKGQLADVAVGHLLAETTLAAAGGPDTDTDTDTDTDIMTLLDLHDALTAIDHELMKLLGATGFLEDGPGADQYLSDLVADLYAPVREAADA
jgi:hypothetical protein